jgi:hypothetical protein
MAKKNSLEIKQEKALMLIVQGKTNTEIAEILEIDRVTLWRWKKERSFQEELNRIKNGINRAIWFKQRILLDKCQEIITEELNNKDSKKRVNIALTIYKNFKNDDTGYREIINLALDEDYPWD